MPEMIERVARELCQAAGKDPEPQTPSAIPQQQVVSDLPRPASPGWMAFVNPARAILGQMREPTTTMLSAAADKAQQIGSGDFVGIYRAMIDAAIRDG